VASTDPASSLFGRLLWPEQTPISDLERQLAATRISHARSTGLLTDDQALHRQARVRSASTRADLGAALRGLPGAVTPVALSASVRIATMLVVGLTVIQFVVWAMIGVIDGWDTPWWLWTALPGAAVVGALHWATELDHRTRMSGSQD